jgi:hypothetical protein
MIRPTIYLGANPDARASLYSLWILRNAHHVEPEGWELGPSLEQEGSDGSGWWDDAREKRSSSLPPALPRRSSFPPALPRRSSFPPALSRRSSMPPRNALPEMVFEERGSLVPTHRFPAHPLFFAPLVVLLLLASWSGWAAGAPVERHGRDDAPPKDAPQGEAHNGSATERSDPTERSDRR